MIDPQTFGLICYACVILFALVALTLDVMKGRP